MKLLSEQLEISWRPSAGFNLSQHDHHRTPIPVICDDYTVRFRQSQCIHLRYVLTRGAFLPVILTIYGKRQEACQRVEKA